MRLSVLAVILLVAIAGCVAEGPPADDETPPLIRVTLSNGANAVLQSSDAPRGGIDNCLIVDSDSIDVQAIFSDRGGVDLAGITVAFGAAIDPASIRVNPVAGDVSWEMVDGLSNDSIIIRLRPPAAGRVRTGVVVDFTARLGDGPAAITAEVYDYSGNRANIEQFDLNEPDSGIVCLGS